MYDDEFFAEEDRVALAAAEIVMPWVLDRTKAEAIIDVGCGTGAWLSVAKSHGCDVHGVDGYTPTYKLRIALNEFERQPLIEDVWCEGYDLAMCLEVAEHLPEWAAAGLVEGLCQARYVFWSAAVPGQRGVDHVNEQWPTWWESLFAQHGYVGSCDIRREFWDNETIAPFYRQNFTVYATPDDIAGMGMTVGVLDEVHPANPHIAAKA